MSFMLTDTLGNRTSISQAYSGAGSPVFASSAYSFTTYNGSYGAPAGTGPVMRFESQISTVHTGISWSPVGTIAQDNTALGFIWAGTRYRSFFVRLPPDKHANPNALAISFWVNPTGTDTHVIKGLHTRTPVVSRNRNNFQGCTINIETLDRPQDYVGTSHYPWHRVTIKYGSTAVMLLTPTSEGYVAPTSGAIAPCSGAAVDLWGCHSGVTVEGGDSIQYGASAIGTALMYSIPLNPAEIRHADAAVLAASQSSVGRQFGYATGTRRRISLRVEDLDDKFAAIVNSWWASRTPLALSTFNPAFVESGSSQFTAMSSCFVANVSAPFSQRQYPYDDRYTGAITLEAF